MRLKTLLIIPLASLALSSCLKEHPGICEVPDNLELLFTYDDAPEKTFTNLITAVDVILFDDQGRYLEQRRVTLSDMTAFRGVRFTVPSGKYHAVAWANVGNNSAFSGFTPGVTTFEECFLEINASATETGDPVYYAPHKEKPAARSTTAATTRAANDLTLYEIDVPPGVKTTKKLDFVRAHRTINVWIKNYNEIVAGQNVYPVVTARERWSKYDFFFTTQSLRRNYKQQSVTQTVDMELYAKASFHAALGKIDSGKSVILTSPSDDSHILSVNLEQFITDNKITDTDEIDIMINFFSDNGITVTIPQWSNEPVKPGV